MAHLILTHSCTAAVMLPSLQTINQPKQSTKAALGLHRTLLCVLRQVAVLMDRT